MCVQIANAYTQKVGLMTDTILVTGGAGYVGSHTTRLLLDRGYQVVILDNLSTGHMEAIDPRAELVRGDLQDKAQIEAAFKDREVAGIFHFASNILVGESMEKPWIYLRDNVVSACNLLEVGTAHGVNRFVLSSTANLFDAPDEIPIKAEARIAPGSPYGESKYAIERILGWMERIYGLASCCLRYFNASGAHPDSTIGEDHHPETHLIPIVLQVALGQREQVTVYGDDYPTLDGTCIRDYIHVLDLAEAHLLAFEAMKDGKSRKYNLGSGSGYTVKQIIDNAAAVSGRPIPYTIGPRRPGDLPVLVADTKKIEAELGWKPKYSDLETILETAWHWHESHPHGYNTGK